MADKLGDQVNRRFAVCDKRRNQTDTQAVRCVGADTAPIVRCGIGAFAGKVFAGALNRVEQCWQGVGENRCGERRPTRGVRAEQKGLGATRLQNLLIGFGA